MESISNTLLDGLHVLTLVVSPICTSHLNITASVIACAKCPSAVSQALDRLVTIFLLFCAVHESGCITGSDGTQHACAMPSHATASRAASSTLHAGAVVQGGCCTGICCCRAAVARVPGVNRRAVRSQASRALTHDQRNPGGQGRAGQSHVWLRPECKARA